MPFSLNLPYGICYPVVRLLRSTIAIPRPQMDFDLGVYFDYQYNSSPMLMDRYMKGVAIRDKVVLDVGSGLGGRAPYLLEQGAERVFCIDINQKTLENGKMVLQRKFPHFIERIQYIHPDQLKRSDFADLAILFDAFEHLVDPDFVLRQSYGWLRPGGKLWLGSIGWYHHAASHCNSHVPVPWCQLVFSESAIIRTIQSVIREPRYVPNVWEKTEGITRWNNVRTLKDRPGEPLNMLSLRKVRQVLRTSPYQLSEFRIYGFSGRNNPLARAFSFLSKVPGMNEVFHSYYTAILTKPGERKLNTNG
jgi:SAM-dependent methyltransferase